jgi:hypothetical protein
MGFNPLLEHPLPCWECCHYDGMAAQGTAALCARPAASRVTATPERGCAFWKREVGADDVPITAQQMRATWGHLKWPEPSIRGIKPRVQRGGAT